MNDCIACFGLESIEAGKHFLLLMAVRLRVDKGLCIFLGGGGGGFTTLLSFFLFPFHSQCPVVFSFSSIIYTHVVPNTTFS